VTTAFDPVDLAGRRLANRIVMAPMSRSRAYGPAACPSPSAALYYRQRASAGLIVSEGIQPTAAARGYDATPGLHTHAQVAAWQAVTAAVHDAGGTIFAQLMHAGRIGLPGRNNPLDPHAGAGEEREELLGGEGGGDVLEEVGHGDILSNPNQ